LRSFNGETLAFCRERCTLMHRTTGLEWDRLDVGCVAGCRDLETCESELAMWVELLRCKMQARGRCI
jgi:hypothetical protein